MVASGAAEANGRIATYCMRHAQGAPWDFMLIQPIESLQSDFSPEARAREAAFRNAIAGLADTEGP